MVALIRFSLKYFSQNTSSSTGVSAMLYGRITELPNATEPKNYFPEAAPPQRCIMRFDAAASKFAGSVGSAKDTSDLAKPGSILHG